MTQTSVQTLLNKPGVISAKDENYSLYVITSDNIKWMMCYRMMDGSPIECGLDGILTDVSLEEAAETMKKTIDDMQSEIVRENTRDPNFPVSGVNIVIDRKNPDGTFALSCVMAYGEDNIFDE